MEEIQVNVEVTPSIRTLVYKLTTLILSENCEPLNEIEMHEMKFWTSTREQRFLLKISKLDKEPLGHESFIT